MEFSKSFLKIFVSRSHLYKKKRFDLAVVVMSLTLGVIFTLNTVSCAQGSNNPSKGSSATSNKERLDDSDSSASSSGSSHGKYSGKASPSSSSSYFSAYPSNSAASYSAFYSPNSDSSSYYDGYYERPRQFSARSSVYPAALGAATSQVGFAVEPEYAATGHGGGGHGGGHGGGGGGGGGWGWGGHSGGYYEVQTKADNSSFGLLGLLGLLSLLSNVLLLITTTAATTASGRRKRRDADWNENSDEIGKVEKVCQMVLPSLNVIGHVRNGVLPKNCSHQEVCKTNKILVNEFGLYGRTVGSKLSEAIVKMLGEIDESTLKTRKGGRGGGSYVKKDKYLLKASLDGRNGGDCTAVYPTCEALRKINEGGAGAPALSQLISPQHVSAIVHGKNPHIISSRMKVTSTKSKV